MSICPRPRESELRPHWIYIFITPYLSTDFDNTITVHLISSHAGAYSLFLIDTPSNGINLDKPFLQLTYTIGEPCHRWWDFQKKIPRFLNCLHPTSIIDIHHPSCLASYPTPTSGPSWSCLSPSKPLFLIPINPFNIQQISIWISTSLIDISVTRKQSLITFYPALLIFSGHPVGRSHCRHRAAHFRQLYATPEI